MFTRRSLFAGFVLALASVTGRFGLSTMTNDVSAKRRRKHHHHTMY